jgi:hypothetical protein
MERGEALKSKISRTYVVLVIERCRDGFGQDVEIRREGRRFTLQSARNGERRGCLKLIDTIRCATEESCRRSRDVGTGTMLTWSPSCLYKSFRNIFDLIEDK